MVINWRGRKLEVTDLLGWTWQHKQNLSKMNGPFRDTRWTDSFKRMDPLWTDPLWTDLGRTDQKAMWHSTNNYVVSKKSSMEITSGLTLVQRVSLRIELRQRKILEYTCINEELSYKEKTCYASLGVWLYSTIKAPKTLRKQVHIIYPALAL